MTDEEAAALVHDHYTSFLRQPVDNHVFEAPGLSSIQVLEFANVFEGCATFASLGYGRYSRREGRAFHEVVLVAEGQGAGVPELLARTLLAMGENGLPIERGISAGGLARFAPELVARIDKPALYFTSPVPFPPGFEHPRRGGESAHILLAIPISAAEHELVKREGGDALETLFEDRDVDPFAVTRRSVV